MGVDLVSLGKLFSLVALIGGLYVLWQMRQILLLVFTAVVLATALNQLVRKFSQSGLRRTLAAFLAMLILLFFSFCFFWLIVPPLLNQIEQLINLIPVVLLQVNNWLYRLSERLPEWFVQAIANFDTVTRQLQPVARTLLTRSVDFFSSSLTVLLRAVLVFVLTLMLLVNPMPYRRAMISLFPSFYRQRANQILDRCDIALGGWVVGIVFNMALATLLSGIGLWALQMPLPLAHAGITGLLAFIPHMGVMLSAVSPLTIALVESPWKALAVLVLYIAIQQLESNVLIPLVTARQVSLLPAAVLTAQIGFAILLGVWGLVLALPLVVVAEVWFHEVIIKDVLDPWRHPKGQPDSTSAAVAPDPDVKAVVAATRGGTPKTIERRRSEDPKL